jgi:hypothetical protein
MATDGESSVMEPIETFEDYIPGILGDGDHRR